MKTIAQLFALSIFAFGCAAENTGASSVNGGDGDTSGGDHTALDIAPSISTFTSTPDALPEGSARVVSWNWTFADAPSPAVVCSIDNTIGSMVNGGSSTLTLSQQTTYTLTCTNSIGSDTATTVITVEAPEAATLVQFDSFGYVVDRDTENNTTTGPNLFLDHGWSHVKDMRISNPGAGGYLYTVSEIPGYTGTMPGGSGRVLCMESNVSTKQAAVGSGQTDFYLQYGDGNLGDIPADVWFQFWTYTNDFGEQQSKFARSNKFLYPTNTGYPSNSYPWLVSWGSAQHELGEGVTGELGYGAEAALWNRPPGADYTLASEYPTNQDKLGTNLSGAAGSYPANAWFLTKIHLDTSGAQGVYEIWKRPMGDQTWTKTTEWIGGTTTNFTWPVEAASQPGARLLRMPTTWGVDGDSTTNYDSWLYMADFAMATGESALPVYSEY